MDLALAPDREGVVTGSMQASSLATNAWLQPGAQFVAKIFSRWLSVDSAGVAARDQAVDRSAGLDDPPPGALCGFLTILDSSVSQRLGS